MSEYMRSISKISNATSSRSININSTILSYFYSFNELGNKVNGRMMMKYDAKKLNLLGNFKIWYDKDRSVFNTIIFTSPSMEIIIKGSFKCIDDNITYNSHREIKITVEKN